MRRIGTIADEGGALRFADYLLTLDIATRADPAPDGWAIWVRKEDQVPLAKDELAAFQAEPDADRYQGASQAARAIRRKQEEADRHHARNTIDLRGRLGRARIGGGPVSRALIGTSVAVFLLQTFGGAIGLDPFPWLTFTTWQRLDDGQVVSGGLGPILRGQIWRLVTPVFLHFGFFHLGFNLWWTHRLGTMLEPRLGWREFLALVLGLAILSNLAQYAFPDLFDLAPSMRTGSAPFGGLSGVVMGLIGFVWTGSRSDPRLAGVQLSTQSTAILLIYLVACSAGWVGPIANTAHMAGLGAGMLAGAAAGWRRT